MFLFLIMTICVFSVFHLSFFFCISVAGVFFDFIDLLIEPEFGCSVFSYCFPFFPTFKKNKQSSHFIQLSLVVICLLLFQHFIQDTTSYLVVICKELFFLAVTVSQTFLMTILRSTSQVICRLSI